MTTTTKTYKGVEVKDAYVFEESYMGFSMWRWCIRDIHGNEAYNLDELESEARAIDALRKELDLVRDQTTAPESATPGSTD